MSDVPCGCPVPEIIYAHKNDKTFFPRKGCLRCNQWFDKPRLRDPRIWDWAIDPIDGRRKLMVVGCVS